MADEVKDESVVLSGAAGAALSFEKVLRENLDTHDEMFLSDAKPLLLGHRFVDAVVNALKALTGQSLASLNKEDALALVAKMYDEYISKIDLPGPFDSFIHPMIKNIALVMIGRVFDSLKKPA
jgi:hypothetical protein